MVLNSCLLGSSYTTRLGALQLAACIRLLEDVLATSQRQSIIQRFLICMLHVSPWGSRHSIYILQESGRLCRIIRWIAEVFESVCDRVFL